MNNKYFNFIFFLVTFFLLNYSAIAEFKTVTRNYTFNFPKDHGAHNKYPAEWWYYTGHLTSNDNGKNRNFGFELTFFRIGVSRGEKVSTFDVNNLYLAHFAITDDRNNKFYYTSKFERELLNRTYAKTDTLDIKIDNWSAKLIKDQIILSASVNEKENFSLNLNLRSIKPIILHGDNGFSQKGALAEEASYYMSYTDLKGSGSLKIRDEEFQVMASAWMDHEVISFKANDNKKSWDWFGVKLDNGEELMFFYLRENNTLSPFSSGTYILKNGETKELKVDDFKIEYTDFWKSTKSNTKYPIAFKVNIPKLQIKLNINATVKNQELFNTNTRSYWEGRCKVKGTKNGENITGSAYVELVGY